MLLKKLPRHYKTFSKVRFRGVLVWSAVWVSLVAIKHALVAKRSRLVSKSRGGGGGDSNINKRGDGRREF